MGFTATHYIHRDINTDDADFSPETTEAGRKENI